MVTEIVTPRIGPLDPPYEPGVAAQLRRMMPPDVPPIALFRTLVKNLPMAEAMTHWGSYELSRALSLSLRDREIVIDRTCVRCGCEYEWGVHVAFFAEKARLDQDQIGSLTHGVADDPCWTTQRDRLLIRAVDALCDDRDIDDTLWQALRGEFGDREILDLTMLCGWYHAISFTARAARVPREAGSPTFASVAALNA
jgi:alkylhydroperoxidase family enzyme